MEPIYTGPATRKRYQSRAEEQIARCLDRHGITYRYEYPLALVDDGRVRIYYPDFQLPPYGLLVEYFGVVGNPHYEERTRHKLAVYRQAGMDGIFLTPEFFRGYWPDHLLRQIEDRLEGRLRDFHSHRQAENTVRQLPGTPLPIKSKETAVNASRRFSNQYILAAE